MTRVLHVIPEDGIGGVEVASREAARRLGGVLDLEFLTASPSGESPPHVNHAPGRWALNPLTAFRIARRYGDRVDVAVFSLWKSTLALVLFRILAPRVRIVLFLHSDRSVHIFDRSLTALGAWLSDEVWADASSTLRGRLGPSAKRPTRVISYVQRRVVGRDRPAGTGRFIFWGRLTPLKRIDRAIHLFARLAKERPDARLILIGPDAGSQKDLVRTAARLGVGNQVTFPGPMSFDQIADAAGACDIYLQLSEQEGAAVSLIEAMQMGLVPVVTPVGEMSTYVRHLQTGIIYTDEDQAATDVGRLLDEPALLAGLSAAAVDLWADTKLYDDDFMEAARNLAARGI